MEIVSIIPQKKSPYDYIHKNILVRFELDDCPQGIVVRFFTEEPIKNLLTDSAFSLLDEEDKKKKIKKEIVSEHIHQTFLDKLFRRSLHKKVLKWVKKQHEIFRSVDTARDRKEKLEMELGL